MFPNFENTLIQNINQINSDLISLFQEYVVEVP